MIISRLHLTWTAAFAALAQAKYDQDLAIQYARIASAAYCSPEDVQKWDCPLCTPKLSSVKMCTATLGAATQAFVGRWQDGCVISVEGTENPASMLRDLELYAVWPIKLHDICGNCSVHPGYHGIWEHLDECLMDALEQNGCSPKNKKPIRVTGHSLGAGVSAIAMMYLEYRGWNVKEGYNFGMPRTGDINFATNFTHKFSGRFWRVTHHKDPIVQLPPDAWGHLDFHYAHVSPEVFYDGTADQGYKLCPRRLDPLCSWKYAAFDWDYTCRDHLIYVDQPMGIHACDIPASNARVVVV